MQPLTIYISHSAEVFTDNRAHGDGVVAYAVVKRLAERGHRLHVAAQELDLKFPLHPNITVYLLAHKTKNPLLQRVEFALRSRWLMQRLMRTEKFDIVHQLNPVFAGLSLGLVGLGVPIVLGSYAGRWPDDPDAITSGNSFMNGLLQRLHRWVSAVQQDHAAALLLSTPSAESKLLNKARVAHKVHLVPYGTDTNIYTPAPDWNDPARLAAEQARPTIFFLASMNVRKGIYDLLDAFDIVAREHPTCRLLLVGDGPEQPRVRERAARSPAAARIEILTEQPRLATLQLYRDCTIFCSPSQGEPFGMAPCEAEACARPLVVTRDGGHSFTVSPQGGVLVPMKDSAALAAGLLRLLRDPDERLRMATFNRQWAVEQFEWDNVIDKLEHVYAHVLGAHPTGR
jgi:glycosyltransferase involved in cell wall biosynthesis